jgi:quercetin dioxygenase-like cupin family protein
MRILRSKKGLVSLAATALLAAALTAVGLAAVDSQTVLSDVTNTHFRVVRTVATGFDSGWHTHPGPAIVQVQEGSFQITQGSCTPKTVGPGETFIEVPYTPVRAEATGRIVWTTTLIGAYEEPLLKPLATAPCP